MVEVAEWEPGSRVNDLPASPVLGRSDCTASQPAWEVHHVESSTTISRVCAVPALLIPVEHTHTHTDDVECVGPAQGKSGSTSSVDFW